MKRAAFHLRPTGEAGKAAELMGHGCRLAGAYVECSYERADELWVRILERREPEPARHP